MTRMNISGYSDYPASVSATYTTPAGTRNTMSIQARSAAKVSALEIDRALEAKAQIDVALSTDNYAPNQMITITPRRTYAGGSYETRFTYSGNT